MNDRSGENAKQIHSIRQHCCSHVEFIRHTVHNLHQTRRQHSAEHTHIQRFTAEVLHAIELSRVMDSNCLYHILFFIIIIIKGKKVVHNDNSYCYI